MKIHKTKEGQLIPLVSMTDKHLEATINLWLNKPQKSAIMVETTIEIISTYLTELVLRKYDVSRIVKKVEALRNSKGFSLVDELAQKVDRTPSRYDVFNEPVDEIDWIPEFDDYDYPADFHKSF